MSRRKKAQAAGNLAVNDAFSNPLFRLGYGSQAPLEAAEYPLTRMTDDYAKLNSMYRSEGIMQSIVDIIPSDMIREWFQINGNIKPEALDAMDRAQRRIRLRDKIREGLCWARLYGGAAGIIMIKGQEEMLDKPLDLETVLPDSFNGLYIMDRWSGINPGMKLVTDMSDPDFGLPEYYDINSGDNTRIVARVHHSRVVRFIGRELPFLEKIAELYWGESEIEPMYEDIVLYDSIMHNMGNLTFRANVDTMEVQNLDQLFSVSSTEQQKRFWNVMQAQSVAQSNFGTRLINKGDQISNQQYTFTGFDHVTEAAQLNLCAKTHIPMTKLFGRSPAGMNATGESDLKNYYDIVDGERESKLRPALEKILPVLCMSVWGAVPEDISITFPPLWTPNATELAQIAQVKTGAVVTAFQSGMITLGAAQKELKKLSEETGMFDTISEEEIKGNEGKTYQDVTAMDDPMAGLTKGSDEDSPFKRAEDSAAAVLDFNPYHGPDGRFTSGGGFSGPMLAPEGVVGSSENGKELNVLEKYAKDPNFEDHGDECLITPRERVKIKGLKGILKEIFDDPRNLSKYNPKTLLDMLVNEGYDVKSLNRGSLKNIPFERGGGYRVVFGKNRLFMYHPFPSSHHFAPYFKLSDSVNGVRRYKPDGRELIDKAEISEE